MMFGGGPQGRMFQQETLKPKRVGETLGRLARYFAPFWLVLVGVAFMIVLGTYTQVRSPELIGQSVDCYLTPAVAVGAGWLYSLVITRTGGGDVFYEAASVLTAFVLLGHWFEMRARGGASVEAPGGASSERQRRIVGTQT